MSDLEQLTMTWAGDQTEEHSSLSVMTIPARAKGLFEMLKEKPGTDCDTEFTASSQWFK